MNDPITVGVLTHNRAISFESMLKHLKKAMQFYTGTCSLIVVNNSGTTSHSMVSAILDGTSISDACNVTIIDSTQNNIAHGRNLILDSVKTTLLLFIDDDELPEPDWIDALVKQYHISKTMAIAGPTVPIFPESSPGWVRAIDLHNKGSLKTGDTIPKAGIGNCLLDMEQIGNVRMDLADGLDGGEDSAFFLKLYKLGKKITWSEEAMVYETMSVDRSTSTYMIFRFMKQGQTYKRVVLRHKSPVLFFLSIFRAAIIAPIAIVVALITMPFSDKQCAKWMKRGFTNLGKVVTISKPLYGWRGSY